MMNKLWYWIELNHVKLFYKNLSPLQKNAFVLNLIMGDISLTGETNKQSTFNPHCINILTVEHSITYKSIDFQTRNWLDFDSFIYKNIDASFKMQLKTRKRSPISINCWHLPVHTVFLKNGILYFSYLGVNSMRCLIILKINNF